MVYLLIETPVREGSRLDRPWLILSNLKADLLLGLYFGLGLGLLIFRLESVAMAVLILNVAVSTVFDKETAHFAAISSENASSADPTIVLPLTIVEIAILVVLDACGVAQIVLEVTFVELAIRHEDFDLAVCHFEAVEPGLDYFTGKGEQDSVALRLIIAPLTPVQSASPSEFAKTSATSLSILEDTSVHVPIRVDQLTHPIADTLHNCAFINDILD